MNSNLLHSVLYLGFLLAFLSVCLYLLTLPLRKKNSGILLLDVGRVGICKFFFWLGIAIAGFQTLGLFIELLTGTSWSEIRYQALRQYTLALYFIAFGDRLEFRSNGIWSMGCCFKWSRIKSYEWKENMLVIELEKRRFLSLEIPPAHRDAVKHILAENLPENNLSF